MTPTTIPGTYNFRDLGGLPVQGGGAVRHGRLLRSDALTGLGDDAFAALRRLDVRIAVDLREDSERDLDPPSVADGTVIHHRPIFANAFELTDDAGLEDIYRGILLHCGERLAGVVELLAEPGHLPAVFFCSAGKDRTGLTAALTLSALGVADELVAEEYARTELAMQGEFREVLISRSVKAGYSAQKMAVNLGSPASLMRTTLAKLDHHFGGAAGYLQDKGLPPEALERLRAELVS